MCLLRSLKQVFRFRVTKNASASEKVHEKPIHLDLGIENRLKWNNNILINTPARSNQN